MKKKCNSGQCKPKKDKKGMWWCQICSFQSTPDKFMQAAIIFLTWELKSSGGSLKAVCSVGRSVGGTGYVEREIAYITLGSIEGTNENRPARNISVEIGKEKKKFTVQEIYKLIKAKK